MKRRDFLKLAGLSIAAPMFLSVRTVQDSPVRLIINVSGPQWIVTVCDPSGKQRTYEMMMDQDGWARSWRPVQAEYSDAS